MLNAEKVIQCGTLYMSLLFEIDLEKFSQTYLNIRKKKEESTVRWLNNETACLENL